MKFGNKVFSSIQLVEDVSYGRNIISIERNVTKAPSEMLMKHETNMKPIEISVELPLMGKVGKPKPSCENQEDSSRGKLECGQVRVISSCQRDVSTSGTNQAKRRQKPRQKFREAGQPDCETGREKPKTLRKC
ncbi:hypothetical protein PVK06_034060 [Gossypium arboreum]|uniref:Uncharacterized protein n=1 Tax=Gossypium arboreum TaxID=29729 RepID=A0ABR0NDP8_GOSAR|nr:hypothetical protein PVK06_034060 [Gossypium arboreum]